MAYRFLLAAQLIVGERSWRSAISQQPSASADTCPKTMPDFMKILQQAQEMQGRFQKIQEELQQMTVTGSAGGGMVVADVTGTGQLKKIKLDPSVVNPADIEML